MAERRCWRCDKELPPGGLSYVVRLQVYADFDGVLVEPEGDIDQELKEVLEEVRDRTPRNWRERSTKNSPCFSARAAGTASSTR